MSRGGQKRTALCPCGFVVKDQLRAANFKMKLHAKKCEMAEGIIEMMNKPFTPNTNGINDLTRTRNGNLVHRPSVATGSTGDIDMTGLTLTQAMEVQRSA